MANDWSIYMESKNNNAGPWTVFEQCQISEAQCFSSFGLFWHDSRYLAALGNMCTYSQIDRQSPDGSKTVNTFIASPTFTAVPSDL